MCILSFPMIWSNLLKVDMLSNTLDAIPVHLKKKKGTTSTCYICTYVAAVLQQLAGLVFSTFVNVLKEQDAKTEKNRPLLFPIPPCLISLYKAEGEHKVG